MLVEIIQIRKLAYSGHLMRIDGIQRLLLEGKIRGKRDRGKHIRYIFLGCVTIVLFHAKTVKF